MTHRDDRGRERGRAPSPAGPRRFAALAALATAFGLLLGLALGHWRSSPGPVMTRLKMSGDWVKAPGPPGYSGHFRRRIDLPGPVKHAWIAVTAREGFEACVNRTSVSRQNLWRTSHPFQAGLSEAGQVLSPAPSLLALNFPREYQWSSHRIDWLPVVTDVTPQLLPGRNVITVEVESRRAPAAFRLDGEVTLWSGQTIRLDSGADWTAEPAPPFDSNHDWTEAKYPDHDWRRALPIRGPSRDAPDFHFRSFDPRALTTPMAGRWLRHPDARAESGTVCIRGEWDLPERPADAWVRLAASRTYELSINGRRVHMPRVGDPDIDSGDWILGMPRGVDQPGDAERLDPDEVGSMFVGRRFESPRAGDQSHYSFTSIQDSLNPTALNKKLANRDPKRPTLRRELPGSYDEVKDVNLGSDTPRDPLPHVAEGHQPKALGRDRAVGGLAAYDVRTMLVAGRNTIEVRLLPPLSPEPFGFPPQVAVDGSAEFRDGLRADLASGKSTRWTARVQGAPGDPGPTVECTDHGPARVIGNLWPRTNYRGIAHDPSLVLEQKVGWVAGSVGSAWALAGSVLAIVGLRARAAGRPALAAMAEASGVLSRFFVMPAAVLASILLVENSWQERHESILFHLPQAWPALLLGVAASPLLMTGPMLGLASRAARLPETRAWAFLVGAVLVLSACLRVYALDFQPIFADEYASLQAILSIARKGTPDLVPAGVYYSRSPAYHYLVALAVRVLGENLWAMRLPSVAFGVGTGLLTYLMGARLLKRPWVGLAAMAFYAIHPFAIYSAHMVRFYPQQQFFSLLSIHWFCLGFLGRPSQARRYLTIAAFLAATLSQEISAIVALQLGLGMLLLGREAGWPSNLKLGLTAAASVGLIAVDFLIFQTWCLTRLEGVSPNVEPRVELHFYDPYNLASLFLGYSRLHFGISLGLLLATPLLLKRGGKATWALGFYLASGVVLTNLLVTNVAFRYQFGLASLLFLLAFQGIGMIAWRLAAAIRPPGGADADAEAGTLAIASMACAPIFAAFFLAFSPWRVVDSYDSKLINDATGAIQHVRANLRPGDAIAATEPYPPAVFLETGAVHYDLSVPLLHDYVMLQKGRLVDRHAGAEVLGSVDDLMAACRRHDRLWVVVSREKLRNQGDAIQWEYPGGRLELYLRSNLQVAHKTFGWTVFLWDKSQGRHASFRGQ